MSRAPAGRAGLTCGLALLAWAGAAAAAEEPRIAVRLRPEVVGTGEVAELSFEVTGAGSRHLQPRFRLHNLRVVGGPSQSENITFVGGEMHRRSSLVWFLMAEQEGVARVFDVGVVLAGEEVDLPDQQIAVTAEPQRPRHPRGSRNPFANPLDEVMRDWLRPPPPPRPLDKPDVLLRAAVSPQRPFAGQQALYTLYLLIERRSPGDGWVQVDTIYPRRVPSFRGFWSHEVPVPDRVRPDLVEVDGRAFWRQPVLQRAIFPYAPGSQSIEAADTELRVIFRSGRFGRTAAPESLRRQSNEVALEVQPLPEPPPGFSGAVGRFSLEVTLQPQRIAAAEGTSLTVAVRGSGQLAGLEAPEPQIPAGLRRYPARQRHDAEIDGLQVISTHTWIYPIAADEAGDWPLPSVQWTYFDPQRRRYETLTGAPLQLTVTPTPRPASTDSVEPPPTGPAVVGPDPGAGGFGLELTRRPTNLAATTLLTVLAVAWLVARQRRRSGRANGSGRLLLGRLRRIVDEDTPRQAAADAEAAWRDFLQQRWDIPPATPASRWPPLLAERGVRPEAASELVSLMEDLHYLRYAPQLASVEALRDELWQRSRRLVRELR